MKKTPITRNLTQLDVDYLRERGDLRGLVDLISYDNPAAPDLAVQVRQAAAAALGELPDRRAISGLARALGDRSPGVQAAAAEGLGRMAVSIPTTGAQARTSSFAGSLNEQDRTHILAALFPMLKQNCPHEVQSAVAEALYQAGGRAVLRPLLSMARHASQEFQAWFVRWLVRVQQDEWLIDLYPWAGERVREQIAERLRRRMAQPVLRRLERAAESRNPELQELLGRVFR